MSSDWSDTMLDIAELDLHHKLQDLPTFIHIKIQITDPEEKYLETAPMMNSKHEIKSLKTFLGDHRTGQQPF